jgi:hypothetical protein
MGKLSGVKSDIIAVRDVLEKHGFTVAVEEKLATEQIERRLRKFINDSHVFSFNSKTISVGQANQTSSRFNAVHFADCQREQ